MPRKPPLVPRPEGRPRKREVTAKMLDYAQPLRDLGSLYVANKAETERVRLALIDSIESAILAGMHYIDAGDFAGVSRSMAYNVHLRLVAEGHEIPLHP